MKWKWLQGSERIRGELYGQGLFGFGTTKPARCSAVMRIAGLQKGTAA
jgi:hypothetical protein